MRTAVRDMLRNFDKNSYLNRIFHKNTFTSTESVLPKIYGLVRVHKKDLPPRPIVSTVNSATYFLSKLLCQEIKKGLTTPESHVNNSLDFIKKVKDFIIPDDHILISLDAVSLFASIPQQLVINSLFKRFNKLHNNCKILLLRL